jgi:hypothetical protein
MLKEIKVDGEVMHLIDNSDIDKILRDHHYADKAVSLERELHDMWKLQYSLGASIFLALHSGRPLRSWLPIFLLCSEGSSYIRVHIEGIECAYCGWNGLAARTDAGSIYTGSPNMEELFKAKKENASVGCLNCNEKVFGGVAALFNLP